jgi:hypothetical protein
MQEVWGGVKMLMKKRLEKRLHLIPEEGIEFTNEFELHYYLVESEVEYINELKGKKVYGIEIVKKDLEGNHESELIRNISCSRENTKKLLVKLSNNTVTPATMPCILDDILGA